jgi:hypothetical protein
MRPDEIAVMRLRDLARGNCPECGATFGHGQGCSYDGVPHTLFLKAPVEWPEVKMREFHAWQAERPTRNSFDDLRADVREFLRERYRTDHDWALRNRENPYAA